MVKEDGEGEVEDVRARECLLDTMFALSKPSWLASLAVFLLVRMQVAALDRCSVSRILIVCS